jgi:lipopolysaccharide/colanic/teichoic acid biosynthesis glycosyltransferase
MSVRRSRTYSLIFADVVTVYCSFLLALYLRLGSDGFLDQFENHDGPLKIGLATCVWLVSLYFHDLYDYEILSSRKEMALRAVQAVGVSWILLAVAYYLLPALELGRGTSLYAMGITLVLLLSIRIAVHSVLDLPNMGERILIIGEGEEVYDAINAAIDRRAAGYRIVGILNAPVLDGNRHVRNFVMANSGHQTTGNGKIGNGNGHSKNGNGYNGIGNGHKENVQALGTIDDLERIVVDERIDRVVVGVRQRRGVFPADALLRLRLNGEVIIDECAAFYERVTGKVHLELVRPSWLIFSEYSRNTLTKAAIRDFVHQLLAFVGLILSIPVAILTAVLIKLESRGPVFYKQERVGKNGRSFEVIKFRSMRADAEAGGTPVWAKANDDRVTNVGRVIRKVRIDEIPQFWNILKGEMKFVGPRPERPHFVDQLAQEIPFYPHRHLVAPGLTGWAQVKYPYGASVDDARHKLEYDLYYIKNQTLKLDVLILLQTVKIILLGRGGR